MSDLKPCPVCREMPSPTFHLCECPALLPCPFCGSVPDGHDPNTFQMNQGDRWGFVVCCGTGPEVRTEYKGVEHWGADAIAAWNTRVSP